MSKYIRVNGKRYVRVDDEGDKIKADIKRLYNNFQQEFKKLQTKAKNLADKVKWYEGFNDDAEKVLQGKSLSNDELKDILEDLKTSIREIKKELN